MEVSEASFPKEYWVKDEIALYRLRDDRLDVEVEVVSMVCYFKEYLQVVEMGFNAIQILENKIEFDESAPTNSLVANKPHRPFKELFTIGT